MSWDSPDRRLAEISPQRVERVIQAVLVRLDKREPLASAAGMGIIARVGQWLAGLPVLPRFARPMAAAVVLGIVVGQHLQSAEASVQLADLFSYTSIYASGF